jgi:formylmethanofuran dehydrogenase subunit E-like metal-binding protein
MSKLILSIVRPMLPMVLLLLAACARPGQDSSAVDSTSTEQFVAARAADLAMEALASRRDDPNFLAMTNAGYAMPGNRTTQVCVDSISARTGCTIGKSNLLMIHRPKWDPLWFAFYNKKTEKGIYLEVSGDVFGRSVEGISDDEIFTFIEEADFAEGGLERNGGLVDIAKLWASEPPADLLQAVQFHNHYCPGITSGYMISKYLDKHLSIQDPAESYSIIVNSPSCKEDAFQVLFDITTGKKALIATHLSTEQMDQVQEGIAGIFIRWNRHTQKGQGLVLTLDWSGDAIIPADAPRIDRALAMMEYVDKPETFVSTLKEFQVTGEEELNGLKSSGITPYEKLGLLRGTSDD